MPLGDTGVLDTFPTDGGPPPPGSWVNDPFGAGSPGGKAQGGSFLSTTTISGNPAGAFANRYTAVSGSDFEFHAKVGTLPSAGLALYVFAVNAAGNGYALEAQNVNGTRFDWQMYAVANGGVFNQIDGVNNIAYAVNDRFGFRRTGTSFAWWLKPGDTGTPSTLSTTTDSTYSGPFYGGVAVQHDTGSLLDFGGASLDVAAPAQPTALTLSEPSPGQIRAAATMAVDANVASYIERWKPGAAQTFSSAVDGNQFAPQTSIASGAATGNIDVSGFVSGQTYTVGVAALNASGNLGAFRTATIELAPVATVPPATTTPLTAVRYSDPSDFITITISGSGAPPPSGGNLARARAALTTERVARVAALTAARPLVARSPIDTAAAQLQYVDRALSEIDRAVALAAILGADV